LRVLYFLSVEDIMWHRKPVVAGSFYPSNPDELAAEIDEYLDKVEKKKFNGEILGVVCPHAGYIYSGPVAAYSYKQLIGSGIELVIVLAPSHRALFAGASVIDSGIFETPLGEVEIDGISGQALLNEPHFSFIKEAHSSEHSLEVQVPFLQRVLADFKIVPVVLGSSGLKFCTDIADELYNCIKNDKRRIAVVISTDLSHYHPYNEAVKIDREYINALKTGDEKVIENIKAAGKAEACGHAAVMAGLLLCKKLGADSVEILHYANSGDTAGGKDEVVGYLSAAIIKS
jgi:MEMO1 family protein